MKPNPIPEIEKLKQLALQFIRARNDIIETISAKTNKQLQSMVKMYLGPLEELDNVFRAALFRTNDDEGLKYSVKRLRVAILDVQRSFPRLPSDLKGE